MNHNSIPCHLNNLQKRVREEFIRALKAGEHKLIDVEFCSGCNSSCLETLVELDRFGLPFRAEICQDCGLIMTVPQLAEENLPRYYKEVYIPLILGKQDVRYLLHLINPAQGKIIFDFCRFALGAIGKKALTVVEIGCASGHNLSQFSLRAHTHGFSCQMIGCEYSEYFKEYAEKKLGVHYIIGGMAELIKEGIMADVLILSHVFEHFVNLQDAKKQLKRLLSSEGLLYVEVPGVLNLKDKFEYNCNYLLYRVHAHIHDFSLTTLRNVLSPEFVLIDGTEFCRAIFRIAHLGDVQLTGLNDCDRIRFFLRDLECYRNKYRYLIQTRGLARRALRKAHRMGHRFVPWFYR